MNPDTEMSVKLKPKDWAFVEGALVLVEAKDRLAQGGAGL
jgi:hypothetical protein